MSPPRSWLYQEQVRSIEALIKREDHGKLLGDVHVGTVDSFQGEEADIVLISLVRSNRARKVGFLDKPRRRGVLLSRAKWAMVLVGNYHTMSAASGWEHTLSTLEKGRRVNSYLPLVCPEHPGVTCNLDPEFPYLTGIRHAVSSFECLCVTTSKVRAGWRPYVSEEFVDT